MAATAVINEARTGGIDVSYNGNRITGENDSPHALKYHCVTFLRLCFLWWGVHNRKNHRDD